MQNATCVSSCNRFNTNQTQQDKSVELILSTYQPAMLTRQTARQTGEMIAVNDQQFLAVIELGLISLRIKIRWYFGRAQLLICIGPYTRITFPDARMCLETCVQDPISVLMKC